VDCAISVNRRGKNRTMKDSFWYIQTFVMLIVIKFSYWWQQNIRSLTLIFVHNRVKESVVSTIVLQCLLKWGMSHVTSLKWTWNLSEILSIRFVGHLDCLVEFWAVINGHFEIFKVTKFTRNSFTIHVNKCLVFYFLHNHIPLIYKNWFRLHWCQVCLLQKCF
jgi:hypothetical protein